MFGFGFVFRVFSRIVGFMVKAVVFVAAVATVAAAVAYSLFDGEQFKKRLSQHVVDLTGRALSVDGAADLQLTLPPRIVLNNVRLKNARWGSRADMARIKRVEVRLDPLSAVSGGESISQIRLDGADVMLETDSAGVGNWELSALGAGVAVMSVVAITQALGLSGQTSSSSAPSIILSDATVTFRDGATGRVQTGVLGGAGFELWPTAAGGSPALAAAQSDDGGPCDDTQQQKQKSQASGNQVAKPPGR